MFLYKAAYAYMEEMDAAETSVLAGKSRFKNRKNEHRNPFQPIQNYTSAANFRVRL